MVHLNHRVGDGGPRHNLLVLNGAALKGLPHVDILQGDWKRREEEGRVLNQYLVNFNQSISFDS